MKVYCSCQFLLQLNTASDWLFKMPEEVWYIVLMHYALRTVWTQALAIVYWTYTTKPSGALVLLSTGYQSKRLVKTAFQLVSIPKVTNG